MDRLLTTLISVIDTAYVVFMAPGNWLASSLIEYSPSLAEVLGIASGESAGIAPLVLTIFTWMTVALLVRKLQYSVQRLAKAVGTLLMRIRFRTLIALRGCKTMLQAELAKRMRWKKSGDAPVANEFKLSRLDMMVLYRAKAGGPGFALSAAELADRLKLRPAQIQESLEKLSRHKLLDYTLSTTDGFENYRLNDTGAYILTLWQRQRSGA
jgi:hypothetical protein